MIRIFIATPAHGEIFYAPYVRSVIALQRLIDKNGWQSRFATVSYYDVSESRNYLLTRWYDKTDATHRLFIDADMGFDPKIVAEMMALDKPVVGAVYTKRNVNLTRVAELAAEGATPTQAVAGGHEHIVIRLRGHTPRSLNGFIEVEACGTGLMLIRRDAIATMLDKMPALSQAAAQAVSPFDKTLARTIRAFDILQVEGARLSDDFAFCNRFRQCGGEIWANVQHAVTHVGLHHFSARYADARRGPRIKIATSPRATVPSVAAPGPAKTRAVARAIAAAPPKARLKTSLEAAVRPKILDAVPATAEQMTLAFLQGQIDSPRWGPYYNAFLRVHKLTREAMIDRPDLSNAEQNKLRNRMAIAASQRLFRGFPRDVRWVHGKIGLDDLAGVKYVNCEPWLELTGGSRLVRDCIARLGDRHREGKDVGETEQSVARDHILAVLDRVRRGEIFPDLILVEDGVGDLILLEGHARATAYVAAGIETPVAAFVGSSPAIRNWAMYWRRQEHRADKKPAGARPAGLESTNRSWPLRH